MKKPRVALAQIKYYDINSTHNLEKIKQFIRKAKKGRADIVCFPEFVLHKTKVLDFQHHFVKEICEECKKNFIWCIITHDFFIKGKEYNAALLINRDGKIVGHYKKIHLSGDAGFPGKRIKLFKTDFAKIGIIICWDLAFPKLFREMKKRGAEIIFCPAQWWYEAKSKNEDPIKREIQILRSLVSSRSFENVFYVAVCNPVMKSKFQVSYTAISSPHKILKELIGKEGIVFADVNLNEIKKLEKFYR